MTDKTVSPELSIVIPCYNEELRLPETIEEICSYARTCGESWEVVLVDDGSCDGTAKLLADVDTSPLAKQVIVFPQNRGKGAAVRIGATNARGKLVLLDDADGATPIKEVERLRKAIQNGADVAIGSRAISSQDTVVVGTVHRKIMGRVFNYFVSLIIGPGFADTQCGFKLFTRQAAEKIFPLQQNDGFSFDVEILYLARKLGFKIAEVAINWHDVPRSKVRIVRDSLGMAFDVVKLRVRDLCGGYRLS